MTGREACPTRSHGSSSAPAERDVDCPSASLRVRATGVAAGASPALRASGGATVATAGAVLGGAGGAPGCDCAACGGGLANVTAATITPSTPANMPSFASLVIGTPLNE